MRANTFSNAPTIASSGSRFIYSGTFLGGLIAIASLTGCAGSGEGLDQNGRPPTPGSAGTALAANFNSIQDNVFTPVCTRCHAGATAPRGLRLDAGNSYALLVGVASSEAPSVQRVQPGNPGASYLIQKLSGTAAVGQRMPLGGPFLPQSTIDVISEWIRNGAPRPTSFTGLQKADFSDNGLQVATVAPLDGSTIGAPLGQVVVGFDRELDASLVNSSTVRLSDVTTDGTIPARFSVPLANPWTMLVTPLSPLTAGTYELKLRGSGGGALAGLDARPLNSTPTQIPNRSEGSDQTITFKVSAEVQP